MPSTVPLSCGKEEELVPIATSQPGAKLSRSPLSTRDACELDSLNESSVAVKHPNTETFPRSKVFDASRLCILTVFQDRFRAFCGCGVGFYRRHFYMQNFSFTCV